VLDYNSDIVRSIQLEETSPGQRRDELLRLFAATRSELANNRQHRRLLAADLRRSLRSHREMIRSVVMRIGRRGKAAADAKHLIGTARQLEPVGAGGEFLEPLNEWAQIPEQLLGNVGDLPEEKKILQAIQRHPEGVSIVEIGNELGVDFRRLLVSTDTLLASGQIDQVQKLFYPAGR